MLVVGNLSQCPTWCFGFIAFGSFSQKRLMLYREEFQFWRLRTLMIAQDMSVIKLFRKRLINGQGILAIFRSHCLSSFCHPLALGYGNHDCSCMLKILPYFYLPSRTERIATSTASWRREWKINNSESASSHHLNDQNSNPTSDPDLKTFNGKVVPDIALSVYQSEEAR